MTNAELAARASIFNGQHSTSDIQHSNDVECRPAILAKHRGRYQAQQHHKHPTTFRHPPTSAKDFSFTLPTPTSQEHD
jgi:hypothetical protein